MIRTRLATTTVNPSDQQLEALRRLVLGNLTKRGFPHEDAEDVAQEVLLKITEAPGEFAERLAALDKHVGYFLNVAFNAYLMLLRSERRRRQREEQFCLAAAGSRDPGVRRTHDGDALLVLAALAPLTQLQRDYLRRVFVDGAFFDEIAKATGTSERAVRAVLQRAADVIRLHLSRSAG